MTWSIGGFDVEPETIESDAQTLTLSFFIEIDRIDEVRDLQRAGDVDVETGFAGSFRAIDRSADGTISVQPATGDEPPFTDGSYLVSEYEEEQVSPTRWRVEVTLQRLTNRSQEFGERWDVDGDVSLTTTTGRIRLSDRQVGQVDRTGSPAGADLTVALFVGGREVAHFIDAAGFPEGVVDRPVPDGDSRVVDETGRGQTLTVSGLEHKAIPGGDYLVRDWSVEQRAFGDRRWRVELVLASVDKRVFRARPVARVDVRSDATTRAVETARPAVLATPRAGLLSTRASGRRVTSTAAPRRAPRSGFGRNFGRDFGIRSPAGIDAVASARQLTATATVRAAERARLVETGRAEAEATPSSDGTAFDGGFGRNFGRNFGEATMVDI